MKAPKAFSVNSVKDSPAILLIVAARPCPPIHIEIDAVFVAEKISITIGRFQHDDLVTLWRLPADVGAYLDAFDAFRERRSRDA